MKRTPLPRQRLRPWAVRVIRHQGRIPDFRCTCEMAGRQKVRADIQTVMCRRFVLRCRCPVRARTVNLIFVLYVHEAQILLYFLSFRRRNAAQKPVIHTSRSE